MKIVFLSLTLIILLSFPVFSQIVYWELVWYQNNSGFTDIKSASNGFLFACNGSRVLKSTNGGVDWTGIPLHNISKLVIDSLDNIYIAKGGSYSGM